MAAVVFDKATRIYPGSTVPAVNALDLKIADGEFLVLVGAFKVNTLVAALAATGFDAPARLAMISTILSAMRSPFDIAPAGSSGFAPIQPWRRMFCGPSWRCQHNPNSDPAELCLDAFTTSERPELVLVR